MRYFFDTEFIDKAWSLDLISIGVVADDGREFYAVSSDYYDHEAGEWVQANVLTKLQPSRSPIFRKATRTAIKADLLSFIGDDKSPEFWAYYGAHDWAALTWLMGGMMSMPEGWPMMCHELRNALNANGCPDIKDEGRDDEHNALADARWIRWAMSRYVDNVRPTRRTEDEVAGA